MPRIHLEKRNSDTLPDYMRQMVIDECGKRLRPRPLHVIVCTVSAAIFIPLGLFVLSLGGDEISRIASVVWGIVFLIVPFFTAYTTVLEPWRDLRRAKNGDYECYVGKLTDAEISKTDEDTEYHLTLDGEVKCYCTKRQYKEAVVGERYIMAFFGREGEEPPLLIKLP